MELRDWLSSVAARNGCAPSNVRHYHGFAASVRRDFPRLPFSEASAYAVGGMLGGQFPAWDDLRGAIKAVVTEADSQPELTPEQRWTAMWVGFYRRRLREAPERRDHLLRLLRAQDLPAFLEVDDGHTARANEAFDREFWASRGGHPGYLPHHGAGIPQLRHIALPPNRRSAAAPPEQPKPPRSRPLDGDQLAQARQRAGIMA